MEGEGLKRRTMRAQAEQKVPVALQRGEADSARSSGAFGVGRVPTQRSHGPQDEASPPDPMLGSGDSRVELRDRVTRRKGKMCSVECLAGSLALEQRARRRGYGCSLTLTTKV